MTQSAVDSQDPLIRTALNQNSCQMGSHTQFQLQVTTYALIKQLNHLVSVVDEQAISNP
jgi:hypothetical protein